MAYAVQGMYVLQYDGTNSAALLASLNNINGTSATKVSEVAGVLKINATNGDWLGDLTLNTGDWLRPDGLNTISAAEFAEKWIVSP